MISAVGWAVSRQRCRVSIVPSGLVRRRAPGVGSCRRVGRNLRSDIWLPGRDGSPFIAQSEESSEAQEARQGDGDKGHHDGLLDNQGQTQEQQSGDDAHFGLGQEDQGQEVLQLVLPHTTWMKKNKQIFSEKTQFTTR